MTLKGALVLLNFELKILRTKLDYEESTRVMVHYYPYVHVNIKNQVGLSIRVMVHYYPYVHVSS